MTSCSCPSSGGDASVAGTILRPLLLPGRAEVAPAQEQRCPRRGVADTASCSELNLERWAQPLGDLNFQRHVEVNISNASGI